MPTVPLHLPKTGVSLDFSRPSNPLPSTLQTPSGLAIIEIQGTIHAPSHVENSADDAGDSSQTEVGRLVFPGYSADAPKEDTSWMKRVYLYVGKHQRIAGEVKKLGKPLAVVRKVSGEDNEMTDADSTSSTTEELEIVEVVNYKIVFSHRPEPVSVD